MTIHLPENLESPILAAVHSGRYASLDDAMTEAASMLVQRLKQEQAQAKRQRQADEPPWPTSQSGSESWRGRRHSRRGMG